MTYFLSLKSFATFFSLATHGLLCPSFYLLQILYLAPKTTCPLSLYSSFLKNITVIFGLMQENKNIAMICKCLFMSYSYLGQIEWSSAENV